MRAIVLLSGGIDSCVTLAHALSIGRYCLAVSFDYGQRHKKELESATRIAAFYSVDHRTIRLDPSLFSSSSSSLTDLRRPIALTPDPHPTTYVPCRNLLFLSHAAALAESLHASEIFFGAHASDAPSYPDCQPSFFEAFEAVVERGSYVGHNGITVVCPLLAYNKTGVVAYGRQLGAPLDLTWSCYDPQEDKPCGVCQACILRATACVIN